MYVKRYVQMLPEPNAESAERHRVGLFTPSSTEGHGILLRADALAHWRGLLPTLLVGVLDALGHLVEVTVADKGKPSAQTQASAVGARGPCSGV